MVRTVAARGPWEPGRRWPVVRPLDVCLVREGRCERGRERVEEEQVRNAVYFFGLRSPCDGAEWSKDLESVPDHGVSVRRLSESGCLRCAKRCATGASDLADGARRSSS